MSCAVFIRHLHASALVSSYDLLLITMPISTTAQWTGRTTMKSGTPVAKCRMGSTAAAVQ